MNNWQASNKPQKKTTTKHRLRQAKAKSIKQLIQKLKNNS